MRLPVEIHLRGGNRVVAAFARRRGLLLHAEPPSWVEIMPRVSAVLSHAGAGIAQSVGSRGDSSWSECRKGASVKCRGEADDRLLMQALDAAPNRPRVRA